MNTNEMVLEDERIRIACECGRKYEVRCELAGRSLRCRRCLTRLRVPGRAGCPGAVSGRSRAMILREFGIDPEAAESRYWSGELKREAPQAAPAAPDPSITERRQRDPAEAPFETNSGYVTSETLSKALLMCAFLVVGLTGFLHTLFDAPMPVAALLASVPAAVGVHDRLARAAFRQGSELKVSSSILVFISPKSQNSRLGYRFSN